MTTTGKAERNGKRRRWNRPRTMAGWMLGIFLTAAGGAGRQNPPRPPDTADAAAYAAAGEDAALPAGPGTDGGGAGRLREAEGRTAGEDVLKDHGLLTGDCKAPTLVDADPPGGVPTGVERRPTGADRGAGLEEDRGHRGRQDVAAVDRGRDA